MAEPKKKTATKKRATKKKAVVAKDQAVEQTTEAPVIEEKPEETPVVPVVAKTEAPIVKEAPPVVAEEPPVVEAPPALPILIDAGTEVEVCNISGKFGILNGRQGVVKERIGGSIVVDIAGSKYNLTTRNVKAI